MFKHCMFLYLSFLTLPICASTEEHSKQGKEIFIWVRMPESFGGVPGDLQYSAHVTPHTTVLDLKKRECGVAGTPADKLALVAIYNTYEPYRWMGEMQTDPLDDNALIKDCISAYDTVIFGLRVNSESGNV